MTNDTLADWLARWTTSTSQTHTPHSATRKHDSSMSLRAASRLAISAALLAAASLPSAQALGFECRFTTDGHEFDLNPLASVATHSNSSSTPPSTSETRYAISLCSPLPHDDNLADRDQCPSNTRACLTRVNVKDGEADRVVQVVPVAGGAGELDPAMTWTPGKKSWGSSTIPADKLTVALHGGQYLGKPRSANLTFLCDPLRDDTTPVDWNYHLTTDEGILSIIWQSKYACPLGSDGAPAAGGPGARQGTSFFGWLGSFFLFVLILLSAYFVLGAWHQRTQYGSTGWDLVPHRAFWADVPYMLRDLFRSSGRGTAGYTSL